MSTEITETNPAPLSSFELAQRQAKALSASDLVPQQYKNNVANTLVALEIANRIGASPLMVMQNLNIIHGRPSWGSSFIIAAINGSGKFTALRFVGDLAKGIKAVCQEKATGETLEGPVVTMDMAKAEGWVDKAENIRVLLASVLEQTVSGVHIMRIEPMGSVNLLGVDPKYLLTMNLQCLLLNRE